MSTSAVAAVLPVAAASRPASRSSTGDSTQAQAFDAQLSRARNDRETGTSNTPPERPDAEAADPSSSESQPASTGETGVAQQDATGASTEAPPATPQPVRAIDSTIGSAIGSASATAFAEAASEAASNASGAADTEPSAREGDEGRARSDGDQDQVQQPAAQQAPQHAGAVPPSAPAAFPLGTAAAVDATAPPASARVAAADRRGTASGLSARLPPAAGASDPEETALASPATASTAGTTPGTAPSTATSRRHPTPGDNNRGTVPVSAAVAVPAPIGGAVAPAAQAGPPGNPALPTAAPAPDGGNGGTTVTPATVPQQPVVTSPTATSPGVPAAPTPNVPLVAQLSTPVVSLRGAPDGTHVLTVNITPDALGPVTIRAHVSGAALRVELFAPTEQGREALRAILPDLRRDVFQAGSTTTLDLAANQQSPNQQSARQGEQNLHGESRPAQSSGRQAAEDARRRPADDDRAVPLSRTHAVLDIFA